MGVVAKVTSLFQSLDHWNRAQKWRREADSAEIKDAKYAYLWLYQQEMAKWRMLRECYFAEVKP